jgi:hypothetical protein
MILTPEQFSRIRTIGFNLPQTTIRPGKSMIVGMVHFLENELIQVPWICMHVTDLVGLVKYGNLTTASKGAGSPATVTASQPFFSDTDVGSRLTWENGQQTYISGYTSPTQVTVTNVAGLTNPATGALTSLHFTLQPTSPTLVNSSMDAAICGLVSTLPNQFDVPGGLPESAIMTSNVGLVTSSPFVQRNYRGPDTLAVTVTNNTTNYDLQVVVTASLRHTSGL